VSRGSPFANSLVSGVGGRAHISGIKSDNKGKQTPTFFGLSSAVVAVDVVFSDCGIELIVREF
jgi:hypothetical protein